MTRDFKLTKMFNKLFIIILVIIVCVSFSGCTIINLASSLASNLIQDERYDDFRYGKRQDNIFEEIIKALDEKDTDTLKSLFADDSVDQIEDLDDKLSELCEFYQGKSTSFDSQAGYETGMMGDYFEHNYDVFTDESSYSISFIYTARDPKFEEANNKGVSPRIGVNAITILTKELADEARFTQWPHEDGVFIIHSLDDCYTG